MLRSFIFLFCFSVVALKSQRPSPDSIKTSVGQLVIQPVFHGALVLTWNGKIIYVDPYNGAKGYEGLSSPDIILITDIHGDHMDLKTLEVIETGKAVFVVPQAVADKLPEKFKHNLVVLGNGKTTEQSGITISAIPMYNLPEVPESRHPKGRGNGYVLKFGNKTVYISGDTEDIPEMRSLKNIDVAFICMNLPYTMDIKQAANAVLDFRPKTAYPYHYRGQEGLSDIKEFKQLVDAGHVNTEVRLRDWYGQ